MSRDGGGVVDLILDGIIDDAADALVDWWRRKRVERSLRRSWRSVKRELRRARKAAR